VKKLFIYGVYIFAGIGFTLMCGFFAITLGLTNEKGTIDNQRNSFIQRGKVKTVQEKGTIYAWQKTVEWGVLRQAIVADRESIYKASALLDIEPRLIVSIIMVEQLRLYNDNREIFKTFFAPLKVLGVQSQFSWGVAGIKENTAIQAENYLASTSSPFYPGDRYANLLSFTTNNHDSERFTRITNEHDTFYSYLYTAIIIKELEAQWKKEGYDISHRPDVIATLFNIGFTHSKPNNNPKSGGASITIDDQTYSFGSLAQSFYSSDELTDFFPKKK
jgi:hypothetical protein